MPRFLRTSTGIRGKPTSSESERGAHWKWGALLGGLAGAGLAAWLLHNYGVMRIAAVLARVGVLGFGAIVLFHVPQMLCSAWGWRAIAGRGGGSYLRLRWIRESVNNLLPLAQIGGELVTARLLRRRGVALAPAIGGTIADLLMEMATQVLFTVLGVALLVQSVGHTEVTSLIVRGLLLGAVAVMAAFIALWMGLASVIERAVLRMGASLGWPATARLSGLHDALMGCFRSPARVTASGLWHLLSWLLGGIEVCLILHFCAHDVGLGAGLMVESLGQAAKAVGFAVPAALGVQEGGYVMVARLLGIAPEMAIALSLVKRLREVVLGLPGLYVWHRAESKAAPAPSVSASGGIH